MKKLIIYIILLMSLGVFSQQQITLNECYLLVNQNYPLAQQRDLLEKQSTINLDVINTEKLPQFDLSAHATYQSDVIEVAVPNQEPLNKDQYRATLSVNQLIYGGGTIDASLDATSAALKAQQKQVEVKLYQLKEQVNQLFFSVLLLQEKRALLSARKKALETKLEEVKSGIKYGVLLPSSDTVLSAELLKINQQFVEVNKNKIILMNTLSSLIGNPINDSTIFQQPIISTNASYTLLRPELELFQLKKEEIDSNEQILTKQNLPKIIGFANGGYGSPGLNMLDNSFKAFYIVGVKLNWNVFDWNSNDKQRKSNAISKDIVDNETEIFKLNANIELNKKQVEIDKYIEFIETDTEIIELRKEVLKSAESQLKNGVITSSAYVTELTNLFEDENTRLMHTIQLQLAKANYNIIQGQK